VTTPSDALSVLVQKVAQVEKVKVQDLLNQPDFVALSETKAAGHVVHAAINADWNPHDHPRNPHTGEFIKILGGYIFGKTQKAEFGAGTSKKLDIDLQPGDAAYKTPAGSIVVVHADGTAHLHMGTSGKVTALPNSSSIFTLIVKSPSAYPKVAENPGTKVPAASKDEAEKKIEDPALAGELSSAVAAKKKAAKKVASKPLAKNTKSLLNKDFKNLPSSPELKPGKANYTAKQIEQWKKDTTGIVFAKDASGNEIAGGDWVEWEGKPYLVFPSPYGPPGESVLSYKWVSTKMQASNLEHHNDFSSAELASKGKKIEDPTGKPYGLTSAQPKAKAEGSPVKHGSLMAHAVVGDIPNASVVHKKHVEHSKGVLLTDAPNGIEFAGHNFLTDHSGKAVTGGSWLEIDGKPVRVFASPNEGNVAIAKWVAKKEQASGNTYDYPQSIVQQGYLIPDPTGKKYVPLAEKPDDTEPAPVDVSEPPTDLEEIQGLLAPVSADSSPQPSGQYSDEDLDSYPPGTTLTHDGISYVKQGNTGWFSEEQGAYFEIPYLVKQINGGGVAKFVKPGDGFDWSDVVAPEGQTKATKDNILNPEVGDQVFIENTVSATWDGTNWLSNSNSYTPAALMELIAWAKKNGEEVADNPDYKVSAVFKPAPKAEPVKPTKAEPEIGQIIKPYVENPGHYNFYSPTTGELGYTFAPGDEVYKSTLGNYAIVTPSTGQASVWAASDSWFTYSDFSHLHDTGNWTKVFTAPVTAEKNEADSEPDVFVHPVSGVSFPLEEGDKVYKHKTTPNGFIIVKASGANPVNFFTANGKQQKPKAKHKGLETNYAETDTWPGKVGSVYSGTNTNTATEVTATKELIDNSVAGDQVHFTHVFYTKNDQGTWDSSTGANSGVQNGTLWVVAKNYHPTFVPTSVVASEIKPKTGTVSGPTKQDFFDAPAGTVLQVKAINGTHVQKLTKQDDQKWKDLEDPNEDVYETDAFADEYKQTDVYLTALTYPGSPVPVLGNEPVENTPEKVVPAKSKKTKKGKIPETVEAPWGQTFTLKPGEIFVRVVGPSGTEAYVLVRGHTEGNEVFDVHGAPFPSVQNVLTMFTPSTAKAYIKKHDGEVLGEKKILKVTTDFHALYDPEPVVSDPDNPDAPGVLPGVIPYLLYLIQPAFKSLQPNHGGGVSYYQKSSVTDNTWANSTLEEKMAVIASFKHFAGKGYVSLDAVLNSPNPPDWLAKDKVTASRTRTGFSIIYRIAALAEVLAGADDGWSTEQINSELAFLKEKSAKPGVALGKRLSLMYPMQSAVAALIQMNEERKFKATLSALDFDPYNATTEELDAYAKQQGFQHLAALSPDNQKLWVLSSLGSPSVKGMSKSQLETEVKAVKSKAEVAALAAALSKDKDIAVLAPGANQPPLTPGIAFKSHLLKSYSWSTEAGTNSLTHTGNDEWLYSSAVGVHDVTISDAMVQMMVNSLLDSDVSIDTSPEYAYGNYSPETALADFLTANEASSTDIDALSNDELLQIASANGAIIASETLWGGSSYRLWIKAKAINDIVALAHLEGTLNHEPPSPLHPGSATSPSGKMALKALAQELNSHEFGKQWLNGDSFDVGAASTWAKSKGYSDWVQWAAMHPPYTQFKNALSPEPGQIPPPAVATKPDSVSDDEWRLASFVDDNTDLSGLVGPQVMAMSVEQLDQNLALSVTAKQAGLTALNSGGLPLPVKRLAVWAASDKNDATHVGVLASIVAKTKAGEYLEENTPVWIAPDGSKYAISPGGKVYKQSNDSYLITGPTLPTTGHPTSGYVVDSSGGIAAASTWYLSDPEGYGFSHVFTLPGQSTFHQAAKDDPEIFEYYWLASEEIESGSYTASSFTYPETGALLTSTLKNNSTLEKDYPNLYAQHKTLPEQVRQAVAAALNMPGSAGAPMLKVMEYKASKGHYASMSSKGLFVQDAPWLPYLSKGFLTPEQVAAQWPTHASSAYIDQYGLSDVSQISDHLNSLLNPGYVTPSKALPKFEDLSLTATGKGLGGMHSKTHLVDQDGNEWMTKAFGSDPNSKARIEAETAGMQISRLLGFRAPVANAQKVDGKYVYLQHLAPVSGDLVGKDISDLSLRQLQQTMEEHVLDWLISNHDSHVENFKIDKNGNVFGIDKGQAFKHFPNDKLAVGYLPPENGAPVWYDQFYNGVMSGAISKETADEVTKHVLRRAQQASTSHEEEFRKELEFAFQSRDFWPDQFPSREKFIDALIERKHNAFDDFVKFYEGLYSKSPYSWDIDPDNLIPPKLDEHTHIAISKDYAEDVKKSGTVGKTIFFDSNHLEDTHVLMSSAIGPDGKTMLTGEAKIRKDGDVALQNWLKQQTVVNQIHTSVQSIPQPVDDLAVLPGNEHWFSALVQGSKTVSHHNASGDQEYNQNTLSNMENVKSQLDEAQGALNDLGEGELLSMTLQGVGNLPSFVVDMKTPEQQANFKIMVEKYLDYYAQVEAAKGTTNKVKPHFVQHFYTPSKEAKEWFEKQKSSPTSAADALVGYSLEVNGDTYKKVSKNEWSTVQDGTPVVLSDDAVQGVWPTPSASTDFADPAEVESWLESLPTGTNLYITAGGPSSFGSAPVGQTLVKDSEDTWQSESHDGPGYGSHVLSTYTKDAGWEFTTDDVEISNEVTVGSKVLKVVYRKSTSQNGSIDLETGDLKLNGGETNVFQTGHMYEVDFGNTVIEYRPWGNEHGVALTQQGLLRFRKKDWEGDSDSIDEIFNVLRHMGLDLSPADETSLELFYWKHLLGILENRKDGLNEAKWKQVSTDVNDSLKANPNRTPEQELEIYRQAWSKAMGADVVSGADWMPKFSRLRVQGASDGFTSGHPYWERPDATFEALRAAAGGQHLPAHSLTYGSQWENALKIAKSGAMLSAEERARYYGASFAGGASSPSDQEYGSSSMVYARQQIAGTSGDYQIWFHPRVLKRTSNYAFDHDGYGKLSEQVTGSYFDLQKSIGLGSGGGGELMMKNAVSVLDDIVRIIFPSPTMRDEVIEFYKKNGITEMHGLPIEKIFVTDHSNLGQIEQHVWNQAIAEEKEAKSQKEAA
jgi:hypothetical protein